MPEVIEKPVGAGRTNTGSRLSQWRARLVGPVGAIIILPLLVLAAGSSIAWVGSHRLERMGLTLVQTRLADAASGIDRSAHNTVTAADPLLDRWRKAARRLVGSNDRLAWANGLGDLLAGNPAVGRLTFTSIDGIFHGAYRHPSLGVVVVEQGVEDGGWRRELTSDSAGRQQVISEETHTGYDARVRPYWLRAVEASRRAWTGGYVFYDSGEMGFSLVEPLHADSGSLSAVVSVDFSLQLLAQRMRDNAEVLGAELLLLDAGGTLLVDTASVTSIPRLSARGVPSAPPNLAKDPRRSVLVAALQTHGGSLMSDATGQRVAVHAQPMDLGNGLALRLILIAPLAPLLEPASQHLQTGLSITLALLAAAMAAGVLYAKLLLRTRSEAKTAQQAASVARREAEELGSYVLVRRIGTGGMGEVWLARHVRLARPAALKLIRTDAVPGRDPPRIQARFIREAQITAALTSPHTVRVYDYGEMEGGTLYYAMELLDGFDLERLVRKRGRLSPGAVVHLLLQVCDSLAEAHAAGLVHRDIKPSNLMICRGGMRKDLVKVLDFGLVTTRAIDGDAPRLTKADHITGTPGFVSPEQIRSENLDGRSDLYTLGCVAFFALSEQLVFTASTLIDEMKMHLDQPAPAIDTLVPAVSHGLATVIASLLAKKPEDRPADAATLRRLLQECGTPADADALALTADERISVDSSDATTTAHRLRAIALHQSVPAAD